MQSNGRLGEISGFQRVITNCRDYTKLFQMLANGGRCGKTRLIGRKTIDLIRTNLLTPQQINEDFENSYLAGYGYGYGMRTMMNPYVGQHNGSRGAFGWTGGSGTWGEADPSEGVSIVYMHNLQPNLEEYWANFAKTGDPNGPDANGSPMPVWRPYTEKDRCEINFFDEIRVSGSRLDKKKQFLLDINRSEYGL